jgi:DNA-binding transcriptional LysR family regulator
VQGLARLAVASHVVCPVFDDALSRFHGAHPRATVTIDVVPSREALEAVTARSASLAICLVQSRNPKLEYRRLYREFFGLFCGPRHPLFGRTDLTLADLAGHSSVSFETDRLEGVLRPVTLMRAEANLGDRVVGTSSHLEEVRRMIVAGLGVGPLPLHVARPDVDAGLLWQLPPFDRTPEIDVHVVWNPRARLNRAESAMLQILLDLIEAIPMHERTYL